jgi:lysophospholipase L1-like esterase
MNVKIQTLLSFSIFILLIQPALAQQHHPPFWNDIQQFKQQDSIHPPEKNIILFTGSSSIRKWTFVQESFPNRKVMNRGFGGSTLPDVIRYADDIIFPYHPKQIVLYCGDNDAASSPDISSDSILNRFKRLYHLIRSRLPKTQMTYISIKPSPSREKLFPVMQLANWKIKNFLKEQKRSDFVDIWHLMLDDFGRPRKELFGSDMLHMNKKGYAIWQKAIQPYLKK